MKTIYETEFDVVVIGGGMAGTVSAVAAAREGAKVMLIERNGYLGGALTAAGVGPMMSFHAGDEQVILGIGEEIIERLKEKNASKGHIVDSKVYCSTVTPFNTEGLKLVLDEMTTECEVTVLYHSFVPQVHTINGKITSITICNKDGIQEVKSKIYVDATGDGDVAHWAGANMSYGRELDGQAQPMTMNMKYCGVDTQKLLEYVKENKDKYKYLRENKNIPENSIPLDIANFSKEFKEQREKGMLNFDRGLVLMFETDREGEFILNTTRVLGHNATDALSLSQAEVEGRKQCEKLDLFMKKYAPGFEHAILEVTGPSIGVRSSRQLIGKYVLQAEDLLEKKEFEDTIAHSGYPIDIHNPHGAGGETTFIKGEHPYYSIPYGVMVCDEIENLIVTGRCISATFEAQAAIRTTPTIAAMAHASGIAAYMSSKETGDTREIDISTLQKILVERGAFLKCS